jgi:hypothetical protein
MLSTALCNLSFKLVCKPSISDFLIFGVSVLAESIYLLFLVIAFFIAFLRSDHGVLSPSFFASFLRCFNTRASLRLYVLRSCCFSSLLYCFSFFFFYTSSFVESSDSTMISLFVSTILEVSSSIGLSFNCSLISFNVIAEPYASFCFPVFFLLKLLVNYPLIYAILGFLN